MSMTGRGDQILNFDSKCQILRGASGCLVVPDYDSSPAHPAFTAMLYRCQGYQKAMGTLVQAVLGREILGLGPNPRPSWDQ